MQHEFRGHANDEREIVRNIKSDQQFKKQFGKDNVVNLKKGPGARQVQDRLRFFTKQKK